MTAVDENTAVQGEETAENEVVPAADAGETRSRAESLLATRKEKMDALFSEGRKYEIVKEIHLDGDQRFETPFGNKGRHGFHLKRTDGPAVLVEGVDDSRGFIVGATMLEQVAKEYGAVEVPEKQRKRRTKEQKAADDAREAEEKAAAAAAAEQAGEPASE